jgi:hypothetical protein
VLKIRFKRKENKAQLENLIKNGIPHIKPKFVVATGDLADGSNCERDIGCDPLHDIWDPVGPNPDGPHIEE